MALSGLGEACGASGGISGEVESVDGIDASGMGSCGLTGAGLGSEIGFSGVKSC